MTLQKCLIFLSILLLAACQDWNYERVSFLQVRTGEVSNISANGATLGGAMEGLRAEVTVSQHGHVWSASNETPTLRDKTPSSSLGRQGNRSYSSELKGLLANTLYYYRAYAILETDTLYGKVASFRTENFTVSVSNGGNLSIKEGCVRFEWLVDGYIGDPDKLGVVWSTTTETPTISDPDRQEEDAVFLNCTEGCPIEAEICGLPPNTNYYLRVFLQPGGGVGTVYSEVVRFHTFPPPAGWQQLKDFKGQARGECTVMAIGEKVFLVGGGGYGIDEPSKILKDLWEYFPAGDEWMRRNDPVWMDNTVTSIFHSAFAVGARGYIIVRRNSESNRFWSYDPAADTWKLLSANFFLGPETSAVISINDRGYVVDPRNNVLEFDPVRTGENQWRIVDTMVNGTFFASAGEKGYLFTRSVSGAARLGIREFDPLAPAGKRITPKDDFPTDYPTIAFAFSDFPSKGIFVLNGKIYVGLGYWPNALHPREFWEFDPHAPDGTQWRRMPDFPGLIRHRPAGFSTGGHGFIAMGGWGRPDGGGDNFKDVWRFTPPE